MTASCAGSLAPPPIDGVATSVLACSIFGFPAININLFLIRLLEITRIVARDLMFRNTVPVCPQKIPNQKAQNFSEYSWSKGVSRIFQKEALPSSLLPPPAASPSQRTPLCSIVTDLFMPHQRKNKYRYRYLFYFAIRSPIFLETTTLSRCSKKMKFRLLR